MITKKIKILKENPPEKFLSEEMSKTDLKQSRKRSQQQIEHKKFRDRPLKVQQLYSSLLNKDKKKKSSSKLKMKAIGELTINST